MIHPPASGVLCLPSREALFQTSPHAAPPIWPDLAAQWREELGLPARGVMACGHQPWPFHPGIWAKFWTIRWLAQQHGAMPVGFIQDHAPASDLVWPELHDTGLRYSPLREDARPLRDLQPEAFPLNQAWEAGLALLRSLDLEARIPILDQGMKGLATALRNASTLDRALVQAFRAHAGFQDIRWIRLQEVLNTESYRVYLKRVLSDPVHLKETYNHILRAYRRERRIRTRAQPFPDLQQREGEVEVPFWWLGSAGRQRVWMREDGLLHAGDGTELGTVATVMPLDRLVPRAVPLMWITRYHLSDVFLHGLGGYAYDEVTDRLVETLWQRPRKPRRAVTLSLGLTREDPASLEAEAAALTQELNHLPHRAETVLPEDHPLRKEKAKLVQAFQTPDADRAALHRALKALQARLQTLPEVQRYRKSLETRRERLWMQIRRIRARTDRAYPFVFYGKEEVHDVLESAFRG